jgi:uncharacterized Tic20 family protein
MHRHSTVPSQDREFDCLCFTDRVISMLVAFALIVGWLIALPWLGYAGIRRLVASAPKDREEGTITRTLPFELGFAVIVGLLPVAAWKLAETTTGWVDTDNDGMLDGFVAGQYDLFDIVLPEAVRWGLALAAVTAVAYTVMRRVWS